MLEHKSQLFLSTLQAHPRARVPYQTVVEAFLNAYPEYDELDRNVHHDVMDELEAMAQKGLIGFPKNRKNWNIQTTPHRPDWIKAMAVANGGSEEGSEKCVAWCPELADIQGMLNASQREALQRINEFLIARRGQFEPVPFRERALEIFGDEHYFDNKHNIRNGAIFGGRLPLSIIGALDIGDPLPFERPPDYLGAKGRPVLVVENQHSYWSLSRANARYGWFAAVAYAAGKAIFKRITMLDQIGELVGSTTYRYLGDIDPAGIEFPAKVDEKRRANGLPQLKPAVAAYQWLLDHGKRLDLKGKKEGFEPYFQWFDCAPVIVPRLLILFSSGQRIAQESLGYETLLNEGSTLFS